MKGIDVIVEQAGSRYQVAVVRVLGQIDTTTSHELERRLQYLLKDQQFEIAIDLSKVSYISSAGWGIFISEIRGIRESGGDLKLAGMTPEVAEVFELLEFHNILESYRTVEAAVEKFDRNRVRQTAQAPADGGGTDVTAGGGGAGTGETAGAGETTGTGGRVATGAGGGSESTRQPQYAGAGRATAGPSVRASASVLLAEVQDTGGGITRPAADAPRTDAQDSAGVRPESSGLDSLVYEIVKEDPEQGCLRIRKELSKRGYRQPMSPLAMFAQLKRLNLESKEKRKKFAESGRTDASGE